MFDNEEFPVSTRQLAKLLGLAHRTIGRAAQNHNIGHRNANGYWQFTRREAIAISKKVHRKVGNPNFGKIDYRLLTKESK